MSDTLPASAHRVNSSGNCSISGCPCRGWSAQGAATEESEVWVSHFDSHHRKGEPCNQCDIQQSAARGGGDDSGWKLSTEAMNAFVKGKLSSDGMPVFAIDVPDKEDRIHYAKIVVCGDQGLAQQIIDWSNQHQSLVAEREQMVEALKGVAIMLNTELEKYDKEPWAQRVRAAIAASEQRSTSE